MADVPDEWSDPGRVVEYLSREIPHRDIAEAMLLEALPERIERFIDLGTGNDRVTRALPPRHRTPAGRSGRSSRGSLRAARLAARGGLPGGGLPLQVAGARACSRQYLQAVICSDSVDSSGEIECRRWLTWR